MFDEHGKSGFWLLLFLLPVLGVAWVWFELGFRKGIRDMKRMASSADLSIVNDVTQLNPVQVRRIATPASTEEVVALLRETDDSVSIGGGKFSMGGQTSAADTLHIDMRKMKRVLRFEPKEKWLRVEAGIRWRDIQEHIDPHGLSVKITTKKVTTRTKLIPEHKSYWDWRYFMWAITETPFGHWRREHIVDPLLFSGSRVHYRNYEASYDVAELEPASRSDTTYVLQEFFVPIANLDAFVGVIAEILRRHRVCVVNISIRHADADPGTLLACAGRKTRRNIAISSPSTTGCGGWKNSACAIAEPGCCRPTTLHSTPLACRQLQLNKRSLSPITSADDNHSSGTTCGKG
jgi:hypothetical protein